MDAIRQDIIYNLKNEKLSDGSLRFPRNPMYEENHPLKSDAYVLSNAKRKFYSCLRTKNVPHAQDAHAQL